MIPNLSTRTSPSPTFMPRAAGATLEYQPETALPTDVLSLGLQAESRPVVADALPHAAPTPTAAKPTDVNHSSTDKTTTAQAPSKSASGEPDGIGPLLEDLRDAKIIGYGKVKMVGHRSPPCVLRRGGHFVPGPVVTLG